MVILGTRVEMFDRESKNYDSRNEVQGNQKQRCKTGTSFQTSNK